MQRLAVCAAFLAACACSGSTPQRAPRPNILLVTIDTWRADRLRRDVTPNLAALAATGARYTNARAAVPLTLPSHATIMTGLLPPVHGVRENGAVLADSHRTLAQMLKENGYRTAAFVGAFVLDRRFGLARGFDVYDDRIPRDPNATEKLDAERPASAVVDAALRWLEHPSPSTPAPSTPAPSTPAPDTSTQHPAPNTQHPFFVWIHLYDPHAPYTHGSYDADVAFADAQIARVFDQLRSLDVMTSTLIVVAGDHGEGLGEHGERTHGMLLYDSTLRVPLFMAGAGVVPGTRDAAVSLADLAAMMLERAGVAGTNPTRRAGSSHDRSDDVYAETEYPRTAGWSPLQALTDGRWKAIRSGSGTELYDVVNDPAETTNVAGAQSSTAAAIAGRIDAIRARGGSAAAPPVSPEATERLRALGYVATAVQPSEALGALPPEAHISEWNAFEEALDLLNRDPKSAVTPLRQLAAANPDAPVFQTTYARALKDAGRTPEALAAYRAAAKKWPTDATLLHDLAVAARDAGSLDEAQKADRAAIALAPNSATARNGLGLLAIDGGRPADAVREFAEATRLDANNAGYWTNLGNAQHAAGDASNAEQSYRKALEIDPQSSDAANGLGVLLVEAGRPSDAVQWFERATRASPTFAEAQLNLGIALQQSGRAADAAAAYRAVLANPKSGGRERNAARTLLNGIGPVR